MPRLGFGLPLVSSTQESPITLIEDLLWEDIDVNNNISVNYQETRTNIVLHSEDTTDAEAWTKTNTAIDSTLYNAPNDTNTANAIKSNSTGEKTYNMIQSNLSVTAGKTYTASVHLKKDALGFAKLRFNDGTINYSATFNLTTGANVQAGNLIRTQVDKIDGDWFRCSATFQAQNTTSSGILRISPQADASTANPNIAVSGIVLIYVWGFQLEENSEPSAYIKTTTTTKTATEVLNDFSNVWDFDNADLMPEADPQSEGAWETLDNLVLNGDYEELGSNLVTNGTFDTDTDWSKQTGWSIANGVASSVASGNGLDFQQSVSGKITSGKTYKVEYTISNHTAGGVKTFLSGGGAVQGNTNTANGTYIDYLTAPANNTTFKFTTADGGFTGSIDNVTLKQVDPLDRWNVGTGWSIEDGKAVCDGSQSGNADLIHNNLATEKDVQYEITYTVSNYSAGTIKTRLSSGNTTAEQSSNGTFTEIITAAATGGFRLRGNSTFAGSVDNVTVKEYAIQPQDV